MVKIQKENSKSDDDKKFWMLFSKLGFKRDKSEYSDSSEYFELLERISRLKLPEIDSIELPKYSLDRVKKESKSLKKKLFSGVSLKVVGFEYEPDMGVKTKKIIDKFKKGQKLYEMRLMELSDVQEDIINSYRTDSFNCNAYDIPIKGTDGHCMTGCLIKGPACVVPNEYGDTTTFLKKLPVLNETIFLGNNFNVLSVGTHIHEITHSLLDRHKGVVENYFNDEVLSIFMEKVAVSELDNNPDKRMVKISEIYRMADVKSNIEEQNKDSDKKTSKYDSIKYIQSSLLAGILFDRYENANESEKKRILSQIAKVLNGTKKLNEFIEDERLSIEGEEAKRYIDKVEGYIREICPQERPTNLGELLDEEDKIAAFGNIGKEIKADIQSRKEEIK